MPWLSNDPQEAKYLTEVYNLPDRTLGLIGVILIERRLKMAIKSKWTDSPDKTLLRKMFKIEGGGLAPVGVQIEIGYAIGLYDWDARNDLITCAKIRNAFAHRLDAHDFSARRIVDFTKNLQLPKSYPVKDIGHIHRLLHRAFGHGVRWGLLGTNPASSAEPPPVAASEIEVLTQDQVKTVLEKLRGRAMFLIVAVALATGMRRGELLALRWKDVDLDAGKLQIERSLEQTKAGLRFKGPKTRHGRRRIALPAYIVTELRGHWRAPQEQRLALGLGKDDPEALVFRRVDGLHLIPNSVTTEWRRLVLTLKLPRISFHALRHTHASQLIASGMDVLSISRRIGHASPSIS
jgi:integrase